MRLKGKFVENFQSNQLFRTLSKINIINVKKNKLAGNCVRLKGKFVGYFQ